MINGQRQRGTGIIEVIVGLSIVMVGVFALLESYNYYLKFGLSHKYDVQAALLLEEGVEAIKLMRDIGWTSEIATLTPETTYYWGFSNSLWTSTQTNQYIDDIFDRSFVLSNVYRNSDDDISDSGTLDPNSKKVVVSVRYHNGIATTTKSVSAYIMNIFNN